jgi:hypothetical protein
MSCRFFLAAVLRFDPADWLYASAWCCLAASGAYCMLFGRNLDMGLPAAYDDQHWRQVLQQLDLTDDQVGLQTCKRRCLAWQLAELACTADGSCTSACAPYHALPAAA